MAEHDSTQQENELAAYLDGELDPQSVRRVEERLARDAAYRAELHKLERAWDMLDRLPRAAVGEAFTKTTIEMVAMSASQEAEAIAREFPRQRRRRRIAGGLGMLAALVAGFVVGTQVWPDPNERLLAELPVLENLDLYYQVDDIEFLRLLDAKGLFEEGYADHAAASSVVRTTAVATDLEARRDRIENMEPTERQDLLRRYDRFSQLTPTEQQRLSDLQAKISADPKSARLLQVLARYHGWLKTIKPSERAGLAGMPSEKRVERIEHIQRNQKTAQRLESLAPQDSSEIMRWIQDLVKKHRKEVIASMSDEDRKRFEKLDDDTQRRWLIYRIFGGRRGTERQSRVTPDDIERLADRLSAGARTELAKEPDAEAQRRLVNLWIFGTLYRSPSWRGDRRVNALVGDELLEFLQTEVPPAEREQLLKKPREEMLRELRKLYFERGRNEDRFGPRGPGGPPYERRRGKDGRPKAPREDETPRGVPPVPPR